MSISGSRRLVVSLACVALVLSSMATRRAAQAAPGCLADVSVVAPTKSTWGHASGPIFSVGDQAIQSFDASAFNPSLILAENGTQVMRSLDGGCSWHEVFVLPEVPELGEPPQPPGTPRPPYSFTRNESRIVMIEMPTAAPLAYILIEQLEPFSRPHLLFSTDRGSSWILSSGLEDAVGRPAGVAASIADPSQVYLLTDPAGVNRALAPPGTDLVAQIHRSIDAGGSFAGQPPLAIPRMPARGIVADPADPKQFWVYGVSGLWHGVGDSVIQVTDIRSIGVVDVAATQAGPSRVIAFEDLAPVMHRSDDGGDYWAEAITPGIAQSSASIGPDNFLISSNSGVFVYSPGFVPGVDWSNYSPRGATRVFDIKLMPTNDLTALFDLVGRTESDLYWLTFRYSFGGALDDFVPPNVGVLNPFLDLDPPRLRPNDKRVVIPAGKSRDVAYRLDLPQAPSHLDVFFLVDVSGSMQGAINGTAAALADIVNELSEANINVQFGVGQYRSYDDKPAYERVRDIGPPNQDLAIAIENLRASGGGDETQLEALYQVATGEGRVGINTDAYLFVPPDQQANFRPEALKVVLHVTDELISEGLPHPTYEAAIGALNEKEIDQIGLAIQGSSSFSSGPREGLARVAAGTGALAPSTGTDCDGDGDSDIAGGAPLVCIVDPGKVEDAAAVAPAIVNLLKSLEDRADVTLGVARGSNIVQKITPPFVSDVNLRSSHALDFDVRYHCPSLPVEHTYPVTLKAFVPGRTLDSVFAQVVCTVEQPPTPILTYLLPVLVPIPAPPQPGTNPQINPQPNPQPQGNPQGAFASQEQKQPQLAYVYSQELKAQAALQEESGNAGRTEQRYDMSRYRSPAERDVPPELVIGAGLIIMAFMYASVTLARARVQVQDRFRRRSEERTDRWR